MNLFLLNPNGILFGPNASLLVGGSFLATTADSIRFPNSLEFSGVNPFNTALPTTVPTTLVFSQDNGSIEVRGPGHTLINPGGPPIIGTFTQPFGLAVGPGNSITFAGNGINLDGAILSNRSGGINLASIQSGELTIAGSNPSLETTSQTLFSDISLRTRSLVNASGDGNSQVRVFGNNISFFDGSVVVNQHAGTLPANSVDIQASNQFFVNGTDPIARITSGIFIEAVGGSSGGNINIDAPEIVITNGGAVQTYSYSNVPGGDINVNAERFLQILGSSPRTPSAFSTISTSTISPFSTEQSRAGDVNVRTPALEITDGGVLGSVNGGIGQGGNVFVKADDITISGVEPVIFSPATITTSAFRAGSTGDVLIEANNLSVLNGGRVDTSTLADGDAGTVTINAQRVEVDGRVPGVRNPSLISSSATIIGDEFNVAFPAPILDPTGDAGGVVLNADELIVSNGGRVSVQNEGTGDAGDLRVNADRTNLFDGGGLTAATESGDGGNIRIFSNFLFLDDGSISASAQNFGVGGNVNISSPLIVSIGNSSISANAEQASGGAIFITAQQILNSPETQFSASSDLGELGEGTIEIDTLNADLLAGTTSVLAPPEPPRIATVCNTTGQQSELSFAGTGGLPLSSNDYTDSRILFYSQGNINDKPLSVVDPITQEKKTLKRFVGWKLSPDGKKLSLVSDPNEAVQFKNQRTACLKERQSA